MSHVAQGGGGRRKEALGAGPGGGAGSRFAKTRAGLGVRGILEGRLGDVEVAELRTDRRDEAGLVIAAERALQQARQLAFSACVWSKQSVTYERAARPTWPCSIRRHKTRVRTDGPE